MRTGGDVYYRIDPPADLTAAFEELTVHVIADTGAVDLDIVTDGVASSAEGHMAYGAGTLNVDVKVSYTTQAVSSDVTGSFVIKIWFVEH